MFFLFFRKEIFEVDGLETSIRTVGFRFCFTALSRGHREQSLKWRAVWTYQAL